MELTQALLDAQAVDGTVRKQAEEILKKLKELYASRFWLCLFKELYNDKKPARSRTLAGLIIKNALDARSTELVGSWSSLDMTERTQIKASLLQTLSSPVTEVQSATAQVIVMIACIELPQGLWSELIESLLINLHQPQVNIREASLKTLGYLFEDLPAHLFGQGQRNEILSAVIQAIGVAEESNGVKISAIRTIYSYLQSMEKENVASMNCDYIIRAVLDATVFPEATLRLASFQCLVAVSSAYYQNLAPYAQEIFIVTAKAMKEDEEAIAFQAIEFWSSVCDIEIYCSESSNFSSSCIIEQILSDLVPPLLHMLRKQSKIQKKEALDLTLASERCLGSIAQIVGDDVVTLVMDFFEDNITNQDWKLRVAATCALNSILVGPTRENLTPIIKNALTFLLSALTNDSSVHVRDAAACTLGQIFEFFPASIVETVLIPNSEYEQIIRDFFSSIQDVLNVGEKACSTLSVLARGYLYLSSPSPLNRYFEEIAGSFEPLLKVSCKDCLGDLKLGKAAFQTMNQLMRSATLKTASLWLLLVFFVKELDLTLNAKKVLYDESKEVNELLCAHCKILQVIIQKLGAASKTKSAFMEHLDKIMAVFFKVFACASAAACKEAMIVVGTLAYVAGPDFANYMPELYKYWERGLHYFVEYDNYVMVNVMIDICSSIQDRILPYCDRIMTIFFEKLTSKKLPLSMRRPIFSCFGAIAMAVGDNFSKYLEKCMLMLCAEAEFFFCTSFDDDEMAYQANFLKLGVLEAYSGIFKGFKNSHKTVLLIPYIPTLLQMLEHTCQKNDMDDVVVRTAMQLLGDFVDILGSNADSQILHFFEGRNFLQDFLFSDNLLIRNSAEWAKSTIVNATFDLRGRVLEKELNSILLDAQSKDGAVQKHAEESLKQFQVQNDHIFWLSLSMVLSNDEHPVANRVMAGSIFEQALKIKESCRSFRLCNKWNLLDSNMKTQIKLLLLRALFSPVDDARETASQLIAKIASIEVPQEQWPKLEGSLLANVDPLHINQSALKILYHVCRDSSSYFANAAHATAIFRAVLPIVNVSGENGGNVTRVVDCDYVVKTIVEATLSPEAKIKLSAFQCLVSLSSTYYQKLAPYIQELANNTATAIKEDEEPVAFQAVEFWSSVCDVEIQWDVCSTTSCLYLIKKMVPVLVPLLLKMLAKQDSVKQEKTVDLCAAAGRCLCLVAVTVGDDIVPPVMQFFEENIEKQDWRKRAAAARALGSILLGPTHEKLASIVDFSLNFMLNAMTIDQNSHVKGAVAWSLSRVFDVINGRISKPPIISDLKCEKIIRNLLHNMEDIPNVAEKACEVLYYIAQSHIYVGFPSVFYPLSKEIIQSLLIVSRRKDVGESRLRIAAYEALGQFFGYATANTATALEVFSISVEELQDALSDTMKLSYSSKEVQAELQCILCRCLRNVLQIVGTSQHINTAFLQHVDKIMACLLRILFLARPEVCEEAMLAVGAIANLSGPDFAKYLPEFYSCWEMALQDVEGHYELYVVSLGVMVDICSTVKNNILPYWEGMMQQFRKGLFSKQLYRIFFNNKKECRGRRSIRLAIFNCIGEVAVAVGDRFDEYLKDVMEMLWVESKFFFSESFSGGALRDEANVLRRAILETYSMIFIAFKNSPKSKLLAPYTVDILKLLCLFDLDDEDGSVMETAIQVLKDLSDALQTDVSTLILLYMTSNEFLKNSFAVNSRLVKALAEGV